MNIHEAVGAALRKDADADDEADAWLRSQTRKERRRLFRRQGLLRGFYGKGKIPRVRER